MQFCMAGTHGPVAQLGAHYIRIVGVGSSNLLRSTKNIPTHSGGDVYFANLIPLTFCRKNLHLLENTDIINV